MSDHRQLQGIFEDERRSVFHVQDAARKLRIGFGRRVEEQRVHGDHAASFDQAFHSRGVADALLNFLVREHANLVGIGYDAQRSVFVC